MPSVNIPTKSHERAKSKERHHFDVVKHLLTGKDTQQVYCSFKELCDRKLKPNSIEEGKIDINENYFCLKLMLWLVTKRGFSYFAEKYVKLYHSFPTPSPTFSKGA